VGWVVKECRSQELASALAIQSLLEMVLALAIQSLQDLASALLSPLEMVLALA
jgi:hypothetical protein